MASYIAKRHRIMNSKRQWFIETQPHGEHSVVSIDVGRAPVVGNRSVQAPSPVRINPPESLAGHPVQKIVPGLWFSCGGRKFPWIIGCAELIKPGVSIAGLDIVESPH